MKTADLLTTAVGNTFRSKTRTILTILAIFVGAFTLTITNGLGTGINRFIDSTVASFGASDVLTVTKTVAATGGGPGQSTMTLIYKIYSEGFKGLDLGSSAAQSVVLMAIVIVLTVVQFRFIERKVQYA